MAAKKKSSTPQSANAAEKRAAADRAKKYVTSARKKNAGVRSAKAREKSMMDGPLKKIPITGWKNVGTIENGRERWLQDLVNERVTRKSIGDPNLYPNLPGVDAANIRKAIGIVQQGDKTRIQKAVKSTKSSVEVGRKQRAASSKKTTRRPK